MRKFAVFELALVLLFIVDFATILGTNISISETQIPTVINGLVTSISAIVGFGGAILVFTLSKRWEALKWDSFRLLMYLILIGLPIVLLWSVYYSLVLLGNPGYALKLALTDLAITSIFLVDFIGYYTRETILHITENTQKTGQSIQSEPKKTA